MHNPMTDCVPAFITELIRAANETQRLNYFERSRLMERAAATIRDYREQIAYSDSPANDTGPGDIAFDLAGMGRNAEVFTAAEVSAKLLEAVEVIKTLRVLLDEKETVLRGE